MSNQEDQEVLEITEALQAVDVTFEHYLRHIVELDKTTYNRIFDDPDLRAKFSQVSIEERLGFFGPDFQTEAVSLYRNQLAHKKASHALAISIYKISMLTGATQKDIAQILEAAFSKQLSKGQISKLYKAGEILNAAPVLRVVQDVEKLAALSRVPTARLNQILETTEQGVVRVANLDIGKASRAQVQKLVEQEVPSSRLRTIQTPSTLLDLVVLKEHLAEALPLIDLSGLTDLSDQIAICIRIIDENLK